MAPQTNQARGPFGPCAPRALRLELPPRRLLIGRRLCGASSADRGCSPSHLPPCPGINECARTAAPRLPLSLARTRVARSFPREGQRGPWLAGEVEVCPCILKSRSGPCAFSLPLWPGDPRYSGQQVCCGSGRVRGESEQGPASRLRGTGSAGRRPRDARVYLSVASVAGVTLCCFQLSWSAPYLPRR